MDREDALALLDVMRMQAVHEPPGIDSELLARAIAEKMSAARQSQSVGWREQSTAQMERQVGVGPPRGPGVELSQLPAPGTLDW